MCAVVSSPAQRSSKLSWGTPWTSPNPNQSFKLLHLHILKSRHNAIFRVLTE